LTDDNPAPDGPPYVGIDWNGHEHLETTPAAKDALFAGEFRLERWLLANAASRLIDVHIITGFHRVLFEGVWPEFAGRLRGSGSEHIHRNVQFGNYRGTDADDVPDQIERLASFIRGPLQDLDARMGHLSPEYVYESVRNIAARFHCDLVRIHPFVNGNGRTARASVNYVAVRYGYRFVRWGEHPRDEYLAATRTYLQQRSYQHFADFLEPLLVSR
jgi:fido (protein-threonine AMPylation protein)